MSTDNLLAGIQEFQQKQDEKVEKLFSRVDLIDSKLGAPDSGRRPRDDGRDESDSPGARFTKSGALDAFKQTRMRAIFPVQRLFNYETKAVITSADLGYSTPGILGAQNVGGIVPQARRSLRIRDILPSRPVTASQVEWIRENAFTNLASPQIEGSAKAESALTFVIESSKVRTIAHWIPVTRQALDDLPQLRRFIDGTLLYGLKLREELEILIGDGLDDHLSGLITQAAVYGATYAVSGDTKLDKLRHAILELEDGDEECNFFVLNPRDVHDIDLIKDNEGGANTGHYIVGDPLDGGTMRVKTLWSRFVVVSNTMPSGKFLAGDSSKAEIFDRMDATVDVSEEHSTYFTENKVAIRVEERLALGVYKPSSFLYGSF